MGCTQFLFFLGGVGGVGVDDLRVQVGAQVEQSHAGEVEKKNPGTCIESEIAVLHCCRELPRCLKWEAFKN